MSTNSTSSSSSSAPNPNPSLKLSIDHSLDVVEEQLASITLNRHAESASSLSNSSNSISDVFRDAHGADDRDDLAPEPGLMVRQSSIGAVWRRTESEGEESSIGAVWRRTESEGEEDGVSSPSSGGYGGERGSSGGSTSGIDEVDVSDEIREVGVDGSVGGGSDSQAAWVPGKRHVDEDDAFMSWRRRNKHFFILSHSGKPIYSRYGDEHKLAGFSAILQAIISFVEDGKDRIQLVRAGKHQVVFLVKGPIYLVCISSTEEPYDSLRGQLELIYGQMILILTKSVNRCFEKNPKFDMTPLLGGTDVVFSSLIHSFSWNPATFLHAYTCLPLAYATRQTAGAILQDVADSGVLFAILMCKHKDI